jgi:hypothetical protein
MPPISLAQQVAALFILAIPIAAISWTITHEEIFREPRTWCADKSKECGRVYQRKFFYVFTCEYCLSHYVTIAFLFLTRYKLLFGDWRGYLIGGFALVWIANMYMNAFARLRLEIKEERLEITSKEAALPERAEEKTKAAAAGASR